MRDDNLGRARQVLGQRLSQGADRELERLFAVGATMPAIRYFVPLGVNSSPKTTFA